MHEKITLEQLSDVCRLCLTKLPAESEDRISLFKDEKTDDSVTQDLASILRTTMQIKIDENDGLPKQICSACEKSSIQFAQFKEKCLLSQFTLRNALSNSDEDEVKEDCNGYGSDEDSSQYDDNGSPMEVDYDGVGGNGRNAELAEPRLDDYILMAEETFCIDPAELAQLASLRNSGGERVATMSDLIADINGGCAKKSEDASKDKDITETLKIRREILPPMWDVYERTAPHKHIIQQDNANNSGVVALPTVESETFMVTRRRYVLNKNAFPCSLCGECFFFDQGKRRDDMSPDDANLRPFNCLTCGKVFPQRASWKLHQNTHETVKPYLCRVCAKGFNRKEHLTRHLLCHGTDRPTFNCQGCGKKFVRKEHLTRHQLSNSVCNVYAEHVLRPFCCEVCSQGFVRREHLHRHRKKAHNLEPPQAEIIESKPFTCSICGKTFTRREHLKRHQLIHERNYVPSGGTGTGSAVASGTEFVQGHYDPASDSDSYTAEQMAAAREEGPVDMTWDATRANSSASPEDEEEGEVMGEEEDEDPLPPIPVLEMATPAAAATEKRPGVEILPMAPASAATNTFCNVCFKNFSRRSHLLRHMKRIHKMQLPPSGRRRHKAIGGPGDENGNSLASAPQSGHNYPCRFCGKTFSKPSHVERHEKLHAAGPNNVAQAAIGQEYFYECVVCSEKFAQSKMLDKHMRVSHGNAMANNFVWM